MSPLTNLPIELQANIAAFLDLGSSLRLARTSRSLLPLAQDHRHFPLYSAVRSNDLGAFRQAVTTIRSRRLSVPNSVRAHGNLCLAILACAWVLVIERDCAAVEWWAPLSFLASNLTTLDRTMFLTLDEELHRMYVRIAETGILRDRISALVCFRQLSEAAPPGWLDPGSVWSPLPRVARSIINNDGRVWTRDQQLEVLPLILALAKGLDTGACLPDGCLLQSLLATRDLALIVSLAVEQSRFPPRFAPVDLVARLKAVDDRGRMFEILMDSYWVATHSARLLQQSSALEIAFPCPFEQIHLELAESFAFQGVPPTQFRKFLDVLASTSFESIFMPWVLCIDTEEWLVLDIKELEWLGSHLHLHVGMLHALAFHRDADDSGNTSIHTPSTLNYVLNYIPIDLHGQAVHITSPLHFPAESCMDASKCSRCMQLLAAAQAKARTDPALERFASGKWHVSYAPIPLAQRLAEARAVAQLMRSMRAARAADWVDYVDSVSPAILSPAILSPPDIELPAVHVDWLGARGAGINDISTAAAVLGYVYEERFKEVLGMLEQVDESEHVDWQRILIRVKMQVDRIQARAADGEREQEQQVREQVLASAAALVHALMCKLEVSRGRGVEK